jgi:hypothetical protein
MRRGAIDDLDPDGFGKPRGFGETCIDISCSPFTLVRVYNDGPRPSAQTFFTLEFETAQNSKLVPIIRTFFGKVERMCRLNR